MRMAMAIGHDAEASRLQDDGLSVGRLTLVATDEGLAGDSVGERPPGRVRLNIEGRTRHPVLVEAERQLEEYFRRTAERVRAEARSCGTAFQRQVWNALLTIPFGETRSYGRDRAADWAAAPRAPSGRPTAGIPCRSWRPAIASSDRPAS